MEKRKGGEAGEEKVESRWIKKTERVEKWRDKREGGERKWIREERESGERERGRTRGPEGRGDAKEIGIEEEGEELKEVREEG